MAQYGVSNHACGSAARSVHGPHPPQDTAFFRPRRSRHLHRLTREVSEAHTQRPRVRLVSLDAVWTRLWCVGSWALGWPAPPGIRSSIATRARGLLGPHCGRVRRRARPVADSSDVSPGLPAAAPVRVLRGRAHPYAHKGLRGPHGHTRLHSASPRPRARGAPAHLDSTVAGTTPLRLSNPGRGPRPAHGTCGDVRLGLTTAAPTTGGPILS